MIIWQRFVGFKLCTAPYKGTTEFKNLCPVRAAWIIEHLKMRRLHGGEVPRERVQKGGWQKSWRTLRK